MIWYRYKSCVIDKCKLKIYLSLMQFNNTSTHVEEETFYSVLYAKQGRKAIVQVIRFCH